MVNRILILTDDPDDANALKGALRDSRDGPFDTEWVRELSAGLELIRVGDIYAILADLSLPDSQGVATFDQLFAVAPHTPIITLCAADQEGLATEAARRGAQGNLSKGDIRSTLVSQALRTAAQRTGVEEALYKEKTRAEITLNSITDAVICTDMSGKIDYMNDAAENITGWSKEEAQG